MVMCPMAKTAPRTKASPLTDDERHKRFKAMAKEIDADEDPGAFDRAFASIDPKHKPKD